MIARIRALRAEGKALRFIQAVVAAAGAPLSLDAIARLCRPE